MIKRKLSKDPTKTKTTSILDRVKPVSVLPLVVTAAFYGRAGTGKTTVASTFPKPLLLLDIGEKGTDSVFDVPQVDVLKVDKWSDIEDAYWAIKDGKTKYKTLVVDALHSMQDLALADAKKTNGKDDDDQISKRDFGTAAGMMKQWIFNYRDLSDDGINIVFLVHDRVSKEEGDTDDGQIAPEVGPRLMPSVAGPLNGAVKILGNTFIRETVARTKKVGEKPVRRTDYCMRLGPHSYYATKVRNPKSFPVPDFLVDPTYDKIVSIMRGVSPDVEAPKKVLRKLK